MGVTLGCLRGRGPLPETFSMQNGCAQWLTELRLDDNQLTGTLPSAWGNATMWPQLQLLNLTGNPLGGARSRCDSMLCCILCVSPTPVRCFCVRERMHVSDVEQTSTDHWIQPCPRPAARRTEACIDEALSRNAQACC